MGDPKWSSEEEEAREREASRFWVKKIVGVRGRGAARRYLIRGWFFSAVVGHVGAGERARGVCVQGRGRGERAGREGRAAS